MSSSIARSESSEERFVDLLSKCAVRVGEHLDDMDLSFYVEGMRSTIGFDAALAGLMALVPDLKRGRPLPSIREIGNAAGSGGAAIDDDTAEAARVSGLIAEAMSKHGSLGGKEGFPRARAHMGEVGWAIVGDQWQHLCSCTLTTEIPTLKAQWREEAKYLIKAAKAGRSGTPQLPPGAAERLGIRAGREKLELPPAQQAAVELALGGVKRLPAEDEPPPRHRFMGVKP